MDRLIKPGMVVISSLPASGSSVLAIYTCPGYLIGFQDDLFLTLNSVTIIVITSFIVVVSVVSCESRLNTVLRVLFVVIVVFLLFVV